MDIKKLLWTGGLIVALGAGPACTTPTLEGVEKDGSIDLIADVNVPDQPIPDQKLPDLEVPDQCQLDSENETGYVHYATPSNFDNIVLKASQPVVVDFYADWCGPCNYMKPFFKKFAAKYVGMKFVSFDVDKDTQSVICNKYDVTGIPVFHFFNQGTWYENNKLIGSSSEGIGLEYAIKGFMQMLNMDGGVVDGPLPDIAGKDLGNYQLHDSSTSDVSASSNPFGEYCSTKTKQCFLKNK